ncbi:MAG: DUF2138 family protein [Aquimonas sp.]|nr:DUF2138 family protein [Aquimonas sp.]
MSEPQPNSATAAPTEASAGRRLPRPALIAGGLLLVALAWLGWAHWQAGRMDIWRGAAALQFDPERPDALIETRSLAGLPRELLGLPGLDALLDEDFVAYYQSHPDRLGVVGALRKIAFEQRLDLGERIVAELLDQPAQVALWRSADGRLGHALLSIERGALAQLLGLLAPAAGRDSQLQQLTNLDIDGATVPVYLLRFGYRRSLLLAGHGDRLRVLLSPRLLERDRHGEALALLQAALAQTPEALPARFALNPLAGRHRLVVSADYLAMGYGRLLPQLSGLRLEFADGRWRSLLAVNALAAAELDLAPLWKAAPMGAAACVAAPVSGEALAEALQGFAEDALPSALRQRLGGPVALCWYPESRLYTPLILSRLLPEPADGDTAAAPPIDRLLGAAFDRHIGNPEREAGGRRWPLRESVASGGDARWQRAVASRWGLHAAAEAGEGEPRSARFLRVALARRGELLAFSLDARLVDQALLSAQQLYPPLFDELPEGGAVPLYFAPERLALLIEQEALASLPADYEPVFRNAAEAHLLPRLRAAAAQTPVAVRLPAQFEAGAAWTWLPLDWRRLRGSGQAAASVALCEGAAPAPSCWGAP